MSRFRRSEMIEETPKIPQATSKRLPLYYRFLQNFANLGKKRVSSSELSEAMKIDAATIRRELLQSLRNNCPD